MYKMSQNDELSHLRSKVKEKLNKNIITYNLVKENSTHTDEDKKAQKTFTVKLADFFVERDSKLDLQVASRGPLSSAPLQRHGGEKAPLSSLSHQSHVCPLGGTFGKSSR